MIVMRTIKYEDKTEKEIRQLSKTYNNIELLDSWFIQCAIKKAETLYKAEQERKRKKKTCFGGYKNFRLLSLGKLTKDEFNLRRLCPIFSQGESSKNGNRKFKLDIDNNRILFKYKNKKQFELLLPNLRKNLIYKLKRIQKVMELNEFPISMELTYNHITITYDESIFKNIYVGKENFVAGIDLNPNWIGFTISRFDDDKQNVIFKQAINLSHYTQNLKLKSSDKKIKKQTNKMQFELTEITKYMINICKSYRVGKFIIEDLNIKSKDKGKGKNFNRLCNNKWNRNFIASQLEKRCNINNITFIKLNPCYTSYIGNILNNEFDPVAAAIEIVRRGHHSFKIKNKTFCKKDKFYPILIHKEDLGNRWKEALNWTYESCIDLCKIIKTSKLKYRHSLDEFSFKVCRFKSKRSFINLYSFI